MQTNNASIDPVENEATFQKNVQLDILRLDKVHPVVSGNKWFKLQYYIREAQRTGFRSLLTFGGAYSNHIAATAYAAKEHGLKTIGVIRGEEPEQWSHTLQEAASCHMQFAFLPRHEYDALKRMAFSSKLEQQFGKAYIIPEGGFGPLGMQGAADILRITDTSAYTHIVSAVGTGTTIAGIMQAAGTHQQITGISAMKHNFSLNDEIQSLLNMPLPERFGMIHDYHFGGYAKHTPALTNFMNRFFHTANIPLDFVYTAKMMYGIFDLMNKDFFLPQSRILAIHSGGLQGNLSLKPGVLAF
ncbi:1-aminocyclopropane-1-carboxylate deaminase/D-cysteine desulfhydrase [Agriterribacter sp.]|uniref:1-aminocyclopropane-1-carboxylate deaminase/D-cysteine desulfhydrase n=1 Tax=Agriterribacter sp. TaxID=2821509 RepID=UPI002C785B8D|nr:pyridoxal-phosphate dependent enzyme [Agriterribacter sp.]HTN08958.1 pyridoxal-phosphate dependent enzyme [Agriterribacter sp.]